MDSMDRGDLEVRDNPGPPRSGHGLDDDVVALTVAHDVGHVEAFTDRLRTHLDHHGQLLPVTDEGVIREVRHRLLDDELLVVLGVFTLGNDDVVDLRWHSHLHEDTVADEVGQRCTGKDLEDPTQSVRHGRQRLHPVGGVDHLAADPVVALECLEDVEGGVSPEGGTHNCHPATLEVVLHGSR